MSVVYAIAHGGTFRELFVTTHPHAEAARQYSAQPAAGLRGEADLTTKIVVGPDDLASVPGPSLVNLYNTIAATMNSGNVVKKFENKIKAQQRVFAALEARYGQQAQEPFNPVETPTELKDNKSGATTEDSSEGSNTNEEANMAAKKKTAKKKSAKAKTPRVAAPLYSELSGNKPTADMKCGAYIRSLIMAGKDTATILEQVAKNYPDSSAKASDVSWNKGKLKAAGKKIPAAK